MNDRSSMEVENPLFDQRLNNALDGLEEYFYDHLKNRISKLNALTIVNYVLAMKVETPEIASRRLTLDVSPDFEYRDIIQPDEVITWVDINGNEQPMGPTSWANELEAKACVKISNQLSRIAPKKTKVIITRFTAQKHVIRNYLQRIGDYSTKVTTTTGALGTQADIVVFSLVRNNRERNVGAAGTLQDLNVAISRSKEKLIILGNFEMMLNGWTAASTLNHRKSPARNLAHLVESKYGKIIDMPKILDS